MPRVIITSEDHGRRSTPYSRPTLASALDIFFKADSTYFYDEDGEEEMTRADAEMRFADEDEVVFYNCDGEKTIIDRDWSDR